MNATTWREHARINQLQTLLLLGAMGGFLMLLGWVLWGPGGVLWPMLAGAAALLFAPAMTPALLMRLHGAAPLAPGEVPALQSAVAELARRAGLDHIPELHYVPSRMVNAFAVGSPERSAIAVTDGLLRALDLREAVAVLAHEVSHVRSNDLRVMAIAALFSRLTGVLSLVGQILVLVNLPLMLMGGVAVSWLAVAVLIFAPYLSALAQLGLSRVREYDADLNAVALTGDPRGLASALVKVERYQGGLLERLLRPGSSMPAPEALRTHPPTRERVRRLAELAAATGGPPGFTAPPRSTHGTRPHGARWPSAFRVRSRFDLDSI